MRIFHCQRHNVSRTSFCQRELSTCVPYMAFRSFQMVLFFCMLLGGRTNTSSSIVARKNAADTSHNPIQRPMTSRCRTRQNKTHRSKWWRARQHVFALACTSDLIDYQPWQALFQILLPRASSSLTSSYTSNSNMRFTSLSRQSYRAPENPFQINSWELENRIRIMELIEKWVRF